MKTLDFDDVREFATGINARIDRCENGEGMECDSIDSAMTFCADRCCEFGEKLRQWARDVFSGKVAFDFAIEHLWRAELARLYQRAYKVWAEGEHAETECYMLDGRTKLQAALWDLWQLHSRWVTPQLSVGPAARNQIEWTDEDRQQVAALGKLPADWKPNHEKQGHLLRRPKIG